MSEEEIKREEDRINELNKSIESQKQLDEKVFNINDLVLRKL